MISNLEKTSRENSIRYAKASTYLEDIHIPDDLLNLASNYTNGDITKEEFTTTFVNTINIDTFINNKYSLEVN